MGIEASKRDARGDQVPRSAVLHNDSGPGHAAGPSATPVVAEREVALRLVAANPGVLAPTEAGLTVLDAELPLDDTSVVDVLATDAAGQMVLVLFCEDEPAAALGRMGRVISAVRKFFGNSF